MRHRGKLESVVSNARAVLRIQREDGSLATAVWRFAGRPTRGAPPSAGELPAETAASREMSRHLRARGFRFVGPTTCYAFMQAVGIVNDHVAGCAVRDEVEAERRRALERIA